MRKSVKLKTADGLWIAGVLVTSSDLKLAGSVKSDEDQRERGCVIVVPGFAQHSGTKIMSNICDTLSKYVDVFCIDSRGTGQSEGGYYFGGKEYLDVEPALRWVESQYSKSFLLGLSLGAYSSLRAAITFDHRLEHLFLVSCPTNVNDIILSGAIFRHSWDQVVNQSALNRERDLFFKWRNPLSQKPSAIKLAQSLQTPVSFLVGGKDLLTPVKMSERVYRNVGIEKKDWLEIPNSNHAEDLFFSATMEVQYWFCRGLRV